MAAASSVPLTGLYLLLYKPRGYIVSRSDPQRRPTVIDLAVEGGIATTCIQLGGSTTTRKVCCC
jgi:16S rRNA U516 pseudouridylate synthase RsuA-like enzyme